MIYEILFWVGICTIPLIMLGLLWIACNYGTVDPRKKRSEARIDLKPWTL